MFWQDEPEASTPTTADDVVDLAFRLSGRSLPCDHAWALSQAIQDHLSWFARDSGAGLHLIHPAPSANGWSSPEDTGDEIMFLPRRARLVLRLPATRVEAAMALTGRTLEIAGHRLEVGVAEKRPLSGHTTLYARHVVIGPEHDSEPAFLQWAAQMLADASVTCRRMVCGREHTLLTPEGNLHTRALMLADLTPLDTLVVQRRGLGPERHLGCGLFVPHKSVNATVMGG